MSYLEEHPETSRHRLILGVAEGLGYLHSMFAMWLCILATQFQKDHTPEIIHGDIKPARENVNSICRQY